jgi:hypothetical protein
MSLFNALSDGSTSIFLTSFIVASQFLTKISRHSMSTFSLTPREFNPSSPRVVSYMNLMVLVQKTRCEIHGKPLWRRRLQTTVKYWIRQRLLWRSVH